MFKKRGARTLRMGVSRVYLDTYYLLEIVLKGHKKHDAEKILYKASKGSFEIVVPQIVWARRSPRY